MYPKNILFDLDGTLFDTSPGILHGIRRALEACGRTVGSDRELHRFIGPPLLTAFMEFYGMSAAEADRAKEIYRAYYRESGVFECAPYPGAEDCLRALSESGRSLAVATSKPVFFATQILDRFGFSAYFKAVCGAGSDAHAGKAEIVRRALEALGANPRESVMVGDRKYDVVGAARWGLRCLGFDFCGFAPKGELEEAGAVAVVHTAAEIVRFILERQ